MRVARNFAIIALAALAITVLPGGGDGLNAVMTILSIAFFAAIAMLGYRMYHEHRFTMDSLTDRQRLVLYASIGGALLTFVASPRLFATGLGVLAWLMLLAVCSYGVMWVYVSYRRYD